MIRFKTFENYFLIENVPLVSSVKVPQLGFVLSDGQGRRYVKALPLVSLEDVESIKSEIGSGNIVILRITPLARRSVEDLKEAVNVLKDYVERVGGDIARLGEERIVLTPADVKIWRS